MRITQEQYIQTTLPHQKSQTSLALFHRRPTFPCKLLQGLPVQASDWTFWNTIVHWRVPALARVSAVNIVDSGECFHPLPARPLLPGVYSSFASVSWIKCLVFDHGISHNLVPKAEQGREREWKLHHSYCGKEACNCLDLWYGRANYECWKVILITQGHIVNSG